MPDNELDDATVVPLTTESEEERTRIRDSNDRDQKLEREGRPSRHNQGYDEVARLGPTAGSEQERSVAQATNSAGDRPADWESASSGGDEAPGGDNPASDLNVDDIGRAVGVEYQDDEPLRGADKVDARDKKRWD